MILDIYRTAVGIILAYLGVIGTWKLRAMIRLIRSTDYQIEVQQKQNKYIASLLQLVTHDPNDSPEMLAAKTVRAREIVREATNEELINTDRRGMRIVRR